MLRNIGLQDSRWPNKYQDQQVVEVENEEGERLCKSGLAEVLKAVPKPSQIKAVPPKSKTKADEAGTLGDSIHG